MDRGFEEGSGRGKVPKTQVSALLMRIDYLGYFRVFSTI
tara:strand:- start:47 stop:163 length:117 start_codon:yes stop_codon:yes gene_type:complete